MSQAAKKEWFLIIPHKCINLPSAVHIPYPAILCFSVSEGQQDFPAYLSAAAPASFLPNELSRKLLPMLSLVEFDIEICLLIILYLNYIIEWSINSSVVVYQVNLSSFNWSDFDNFSGFSVLYWAIKNEKLIILIFGADIMRSEIEPIILQIASYRWETISYLNMKI